MMEMQHCLEDLYQHVTGIMLQHNPHLWARLPERWGKHWKGEEHTYPLPCCHGVIGFSWRVEKLSGREYNANQTQIHPTHQGVLAPAVHQDHGV